jgi:SAM-dependent methyltransferase
MANRGSNIARNEWAVDLLELDASDHVLEIGFGPGLAIGAMARTVTAGCVVGIDHSPVMVRTAQRRNMRAVRAGRVHLIAAGAEDLPRRELAFAEPFDRILAANSIGFWPDPVEQLRSLRELLRPGGVIELLSQPRCPGADATTTEHAADELAELLTSAGFIQPRTEQLALDPPVAAVLGTSPDPTTQ